MKKLILLIACAVFLNANLNKNIKDLLGTKEYNTHKNLINYAFSNKDSFYSSGEVDYTKITKTLKKNGLLKFNHGSRFINVTFNISNNPRKSLKILKDTLKSLGHYYYFTQKALSNGSKMKWTIKLKTAAAINPLRLSQALDRQNCRLTNIKREGTYDWSYFVDSNNSRISKAKSLASNKLTLKKTSKPYMVNIAGAKRITIVSNAGNRWHPNIVFYDVNLDVINIYKNKKIKKSLKLELPDDTHYIKINDLYSLNNLKRGISITKE